ncbi:MBL fold metallo-hydrolase [Sporosarcina cyprini]|uniref:MBL fold metallo-hydrolase n=1 Tax=Sporosarcina cyprini TaxID=2910523 RepID=UPI001EDDE4C0|nr:MBL fold metallo-hydrolase [Sporosarcina cyprini]MCG3088971.1 MBL fold metallo-hydrolase [Sporosarcina cyprini]
MLKKLSDTIYYLPNQNDKERPTLGLICGEQYSLLIDAGNSTKHAEIFVKEIEKLDVPPIKYLVITHAHWDHFLGMSEINATIIVNRETNRRLQQWQTFSFDDQSLQHYVNSNEMSDFCRKIIQEDIPERDRFTVRSPDIIFENSLVIDLGNKICHLEQIASTHTDDSTIVYIADEKVIFLGDSAYGTTTNSLYHFKQSLLLPMIKDIQKYDAKWFLLGHESICDVEEMDTYWRELILASEAVLTDSMQISIDNFTIANEREPNDNEKFFIQAFVNDRILQMRNDS